jgi:hypothetical protein
MKEQIQEARTMAIKSCSSCDGALLDRDKFCRWCGVRQPNSASLEHCGRGSSQIEVSNTLTGATVAMQVAPRTDVYRRVSGPLVNAVVTGALAAPSTESHSAFIKRVILALISVPIWLIIVLLSPLDAYAAVKNLARQV